MCVEVCVCVCVCLPPCGPMGGCRPWAPQPPHGQPHQHAHRCVSTPACLCNMYHAPRCIGIGMYLGACAACPRPLMGSPQSTPTLVWRLCVSMCVYPCVYMCIYVCVPMCIRYVCIPMCADASPRGASVYMCMYVYVYVRKKRKDYALWGVDEGWGGPPPHMCMYVYVCVHRCPSQAQADQFMRPPAPSWAAPSVHPSCAVCMARSMVCECMGARQPPGLWRVHQCAPPTRACAQPPPPALKTRTHHFLQP